jgi:hypothetical protein
MGDGVLKRYAQRFKRTLDGLKRISSYPGFDHGSSPSIDIVSASSEFAVIGRVGSSILDISRRCALERTLQRF